MAADEQRDSAEDAVHRDNALAFIRHPSAFVYSAGDYAQLREIAHDGLNESPNPLGEPSELE
ncbi:MAG: hypothetical protein ABJF01_06255 [bacterium]